MSDKESYESNRRGSRGSRGRGRGCRRGATYSKRPDHYESPENPKFESNWTEVINDFEQMNLKPELVHGIFSYGFKHPTEIQSLSIKPIYLGRSVVVISPISSGKTSSYMIGIIQSIKNDEKTTQALVLTPDDISAYQTHRFFQNICNRMKDFHISVFKEFDSNQQQKEEAAKQSHVVIATPKTALKLIKEGILRCENLKIVCLDEADFILEDEGIDRIKEIFGFIKPDIQILMFSNKKTPQIINMMDDMIHDPVKIVAKESSFLKENRQFYVNIDKDEYKFPTLIDIYGQIPCQKVVIFVNNKRTVDYLQYKFRESNFEVSAIHEGLGQKEIEESIQNFIAGSSRIIISTGDLLRFVNIYQVNLVFNYEIPDSPEQYLNRLKISNRYGVIINICNTNEIKKIAEFQYYFNTKIEELPVDFAEILRGKNEYIE